jgi:purine nucleosidase/pyrimidine-specific ribonucleoside hydrolase
MAKKILIDTDIGDDIDDAEAIVLALNSPEVEIVGITTVFKNTLARAKITRKLLDLGGRGDIPVYVGCGQPLMFKVDDKEIPCQYTNDLDSVIINTDIHAVDFIIDTIMASPGEITLVPIGALTNIALAMMKEPRIKEAVKEIVWMGGAFYYHFRTWNALCDPEAVRYVFENIPAKLKIVSRDVCNKCIFTAEQIDMVANKAKNPMLGYLIELIRLWQNSQEDQGSIIFDALTIAAIFDSDCFLKFKDEYVGVETQGVFTRGMTFVYEENFARTMRKKGSEVEKCILQNSPIKVAYDVKAEEFVKFYIERLLKS